MVYKTKIGLWKVDESIGLSGEQNEAGEQRQQTIQYDPKKNHPNDEDIAA